MSTYDQTDGERVVLGSATDVNREIYFDKSANQLVLQVPAGSDGIALPEGTLHVKDGGDEVQGSNSRTTAVTMSNFSGQIKGDDASLAALVIATFTVTNTLVDPEDTIILTKVSGDADTMAFVGSVAAGSFTVSVINLHASSADTTFFIFNVLLIKGSKT